MKIQKRTGYYIVFVKTRTAYFTIYQIKITLFQEHMIKIVAQISIL